MCRFSLPLVLTLMLSFSSCLAEAGPGEYVSPEEHAWVTEHPVIHKLLDPPTNIVRNTIELRWNSIPT
jgi:hypothetical protein